MALAETPDVRRFGRLRAWRLALEVLVVLGLLLAAYLAVRNSVNEQRAVQNLPPDERAATFATRWQAFQELCLPSARKGLGARCESDAKFLKRFPECDEACQEGLTLYLPRSTR